MTAWTNVRCGMSEILGSGRGEKMIDRQLALDAMRKWGLSRQTDMVIEEVGEFLSAWNKLKRKRITEEEYIEEVVDAYIMLSQMRVIYGERFEKIFKRKLDSITYKVYLPNEIEKSKKE